MARVSISEAAQLVKVSRPTIYKMINSGKLSYTSVVRLEMSILIPFVRLCSFWNTSTNLLHHPIPRGGNSGKNPDPAMLQFSSPVIPGRS